MGLLGGLFSGGQGNGYAAMQGQIQQGMNALNSNYGAGQKALQPWQQGGLNAFNQYGNALNGMANPQQYYNQMMSGYQMSPGAQFQMQQGINAGNQAAAAGGTLGSGAEQEQLDKYSQGITNQDQQQYFQNQMGIHNQYLGGLQNMAGMGYGATNALNQNYMGLGNQLANQYDLMGGAQFGQHAAQGGGLGSALGFAGGLVGDFL